MRLTETGQSPGSGRCVPESALVVRRRGLCDYESVWRDMVGFTEARGPQTPDEVWLLEHFPVYTVGLSCKDAGSHGPGGVPLVASDRGGLITYHGPGQLVVYLLVDLRRRALGVRSLVAALEQAVIDLLARGGSHGERRTGAPGVYVDERKIASLGLRVRRGCSYHGLSLNVAMDLAPFERIDPCGYPGLKVTQLATLGLDTGMEQVGTQLLDSLTAALGYSRWVTAERHATQGPAL